MAGLIRSYAHWLHTRWPAGTVEKLPEVGDRGSTVLPGVRIVGDLTGIPLLKFSSDSGAKAVRAFLEEPGFEKGAGEMLDLAIVGAGVAGVSAAIEASKAGLTYEIYEASQTFSTVVNFPKAKPIYTYPTNMTPGGGIQYPPEADVKERLLEEMEKQRVEHGVEPKALRIEKVESKGGVVLLFPSKGEPIKARRAIIAIGRSGNFRKLGVPGEDLDKVSNRLHDPKDFKGKNALVVGGGDSAMETAIALAICGAKVTLSYRKKDFSRPKPGNIEKIRVLAKHPEAEMEVEHPTSERISTSAASWMRGKDPAGSLKLAMNTEVERITQDAVALKDNAKGQTEEIPNDVVFAMIGREAPLDFFRRSGLPLTGEIRAKGWILLAVFLLFCTWMYHWKKPGVVILKAPPFTWVAQIGDAWKKAGWFPYELSKDLASAAAASPAGKVLQVSLSEPGFYYSLAYCVCVVLFGISRIRRRKTPYVTRQTIVLMLVQTIPLFLLPYLVLPLMGRYGWFDGGIGKWVADELFPVVYYGHGREYWRAFGLILAWPLFIWNAFTEHPMWGWLIISAIQTFVIIPVIIYRWGKGAYCGWICSCGALAETMGDQFRHKMPHGPRWNRVNMVGQVFLFFALALMAFRTAGWIAGPGSWPDRAFYYLLHDLPLFNYIWFVDLFWAGILGVGLYFWFSGRVWCRFACPLAALMHIYARFSKFRIFPEKSKCISCNVCTSVCHQGIDIMNFANKGIPMQDPECVRCSACVQQCPTGVLSFGRLDSSGGIVRDKLGASPVRMREGLDQ